MTTNPTTAEAVAESPAKGASPAEGASPARCASLAGGGTAQVFVVSSWLQLLNLSTAICSGLLDDADERVLLVSDTRTICEVGPSFAEDPVAAPLLEAFDRTIDYNAWIHPHHPAQWTPRINEIPMWTRTLLPAWQLDGRHVQLFVESVQGNPAQALARLFPDAEIFVHSDGLMTYGPTRSQPPHQLWQRLRGLVYMDLVPDLTPLLLAEYDTLTHIPVRADQLRAQVERVAAAVDTSALAGTAEASAPAASTGTTEATAPATPTGTGLRSCMIIGQYLADVSLFSLEKETAIYEQMIDHAIAAGHERIYLKPHPAASQSIQSALQHRAASRGVPFEVIHSHLPVEVCAQVLAPDAVYSCFSTGMVTAWRLFDIPATAFGTAEALEDFRPYENSNRIPVTICDYLFGADTSAQESLQAIVDTVGYCMQSRRLPQLRSTAVEMLSRSLPAYRRYFKRRRLTKLGLPGAAPTPSTGQQAVRLGLRGVRHGLSLLGPRQEQVEDALRQLRTRTAGIVQKARRR